MFKVISHHDKEAWDNIIHHLSQADIYKGWGYVNGLKLNGDGDLLLFTYINDETEIINIALKRDIRKVKHFKSLPKNKHFDLISPYGYGGTLIQTTNEADITAYFKALQKYCLKKHII